MSKRGAYAKTTQSPRRLYKHHGRIFAAWCLDHALAQLGPDQDPTALRIWTGSEYVKCNVPN